MAKDITQTTNDLESLNPLVKVMLTAALDEIENNEINPLVVETYRPLERQYFLYCKDRTLEEAIAGGVPKTMAAKYIYLNKGYTGGKVTWTLNSIHIQRKAVDLIPQRKVNDRMTAIWDNNDKETREIIKTMCKYGFESGANWKNNIDSPHFQVAGNFTKTFDKKHNNIYVTTTIQNALNRAVDANLEVDGKWGAGTDAAIIKFRKKLGYKLTTPVLGEKALQELFKYL